jgi:lipoate-protein ligase A
LPWVRRSTGGAGIIHHRELTYAFALPSRQEWKSAESWICRFHHLVQSVLEDVGVASRLVVCGDEQKLGEVICFLHQTPGDLIISGSKVAGSAQRKLRGALLQHGSLLLRRSEFAPMLPGMEDLAGRDLFTPQDLAERLTTRFAKDTTAKIELGEWSATERERIAEIAAQKYANPEWNSKR